MRISPLKAQATSHTLTHCAQAQYAMYRRSKRRTSISSPQWLQAPAYSEVGRGRSAIGSRRPQARRITRTSFLASRTGGSTIMSVFPQSEWI